MYDCWVNAFNHDGGSPIVEPDQSFLNDLTLGAQQLCFNNERNTLVDAYVVHFCDDRIGRGVNDLQLDI